STAARSSPPLRTRSSSFSTCAKRPCAKRWKQPKVCARSTPRANGSTPRKKKWRRVSGQIVQSLKEFHAGHPLVPGMDMEELRGKLAYELAPKIFRLIVDALSAEKLIAREENLLRLASHRVQLGGQEKTLMEKVKTILGAEPLA